MTTSIRWVSALVFGAVLVVAQPVESMAQSASGGGAPAVTAASYRQGLMQQFQANMAALNAVRSGQAGAQSHVLARATILQQLAAMMSESWTDRSQIEGTRALVAIWDNAPEFAEKVQALQTASSALVDAARSGDSDRVGAAQQALQGTCMSCHTQFRGPPVQR